MAGSGTAHLRDGRKDILLQARNLRRVYHGRVQALSDVSFDVARGETLGIVGESGCGKSTLARAVLRLPGPTSGSVTFDGVSVLECDPPSLRQLRQRMQMVFQDPVSSLNPRHRVLDIVEAPLIVAGRKASARRSAVEKVLHTVGLDPAVFGHRRPHELSGGQCQRVSLARALVLHPSLLVCDEPVSALDVSVQAQVINLLEDSKALFGLTMLFIAHDLAVVRSISDRIMVMYLGKVCEVGSADAVYARPRHPYTAALMAAVPVADPDRPRQRSNLLTGEAPSPLNVPSGCRFRTRCPRASATCAEKEPAMTGVGEDHFVACHHPLPAAGT